MENRPFLFEEAGGTRGNYDLGVEVMPKQKPKTSLPKQSGGE
jgi:hypothetical protein